MREGSGNGASLINLISGPFLDPDYIRNLSMGAKRNFCGGAGHQIMENKGPVLRPRCICTPRAQTQILFYAILPPLISPSVRILQLSDLPTGTDARRYVRAQLNT